MIFRSSLWPFSLFRMRTIFVGNRWNVLRQLCWSGAILLMGLSCICNQHFVNAAQQPSKTKDAPISVKFTDIRKSAGITFVQDSTESDEKYYLETMGTGVGWIDYDQDGLMDLYFVQSGATSAYKPSKPLHSALYRNNGDGTFTDVTEKARVGGEGHYGQGVAVADYDNDGFPDMYVTGLSLIHI